MLDSILRVVLDNRAIVLALAALVVAVGAWIAPQLPLDAFPDVSPNLVQVFTVTEGLAPEEIETYVTFPVESAMAGLPGVVRTRSVSNFGLSVVNIYFEDDLDIYLARQVVGERLVEAREQIPEGFGEPEMGPISTGMGQVLFYYLEDETGRYGLTELRSLQDWVVKYHLQNVPGVTEVLGIGGHEKQFQVIVDPEALLRYDVSLSELVEAVHANNLNVGAQFLERGSEEIIVRSLGLVTGTGDIESIVIRAVEGTPIRVGDIAHVEVGGAIRRGLQTKDGVAEVVAGQVIKLFGANSSEVIARVEARLDEINRILPEGVSIKPYYEQKSLVEACVHTVRDALLVGIVLVLVVLFVFLGRIGPSLVVAASIPFSVLAALIGMRVFDLSANLMSLGGLAIAIGMMVDGSIVVVENASRRRSIFDAAREVLRPISFAALVVIVTFLPLFALQGVEGKTFRPLAYTVSMAMLASLVFTAFVTPPLASLLVRPRGQELRRGLAERALAMLEGAYARVLAAVIERSWVAWAAILLLVVVGGATASRLGSEFTPKLEEGTLVLRLTMAPSISLNESRDTAMALERRLIEMPEVESVVTRIGRGEVGAHTDPINSAEMYLLLAPEDTWRVESQSALSELMREHLGEVPGVLMNFTQPIEMSVDELLEGIRAELAVKVVGEDLRVLRRQADAVAAALSEVPGAADVQVDQVSGTPQLLISLRRDALARYGVSVETVQQTLSAAVGGARAGEVFEGIRRASILVRYREDLRKTPQQIERLLVPLPAGASVPLGQLVEMKEIVGPRQITREDGQRFVAVQCNVRGRDIGGFVREAQALMDQRVDLPAGYLVSWGGQFRLQQEANERFALVVPVTALLVFVLLYASFGRLRPALLVLLNVPLALVGGVLGLALSGQHLSVPASVGFIALFGIALGNGMVLVTAIGQELERGVALRDAVLEASRRRLRPVLMTALTTGLGLTPLLFATGTGSEVQRPLATVVNGGLLTSTLITLLVLPALARALLDRKEL